MRKEIIDLDYRDYGDREDLSKDKWEQVNGGQQPMLSCQPMPARPLEWKSEEPPREPPASGLRGAGEPLWSEKLV